MIIRVAFITVIYTTMMMMIMIVITAAKNIKYIDNETTIIATTLTAIKEITNNQPIN